MPRITRAGRVPLLLLLLAATGPACNINPPIDPIAFISVTIEPAPVTIPQGGQQQLTVTVTRSDGVSGLVALRVDGAPDGVTATISVGATTEGVTTAAITVQVAAAVPVGT